MKRQPKLSLSEKGRKGARAQQVARQEQREAEEVQAKVKASTRRQPGILADVPPWCHLCGNRSPEEAAAEALKARKTASATDALVLLWNLRRVAAADAEFLASAEQSSASDDPETAVNGGTGDQTASQPTCLPTEQRPLDALRHLFTMGFPTEVACAVIAEAYGLFTAEELAPLLGDRGTSEKQYAQAKHALLELFHHQPRGIAR